MRIPEGQRAQVEARLAGDLIVWLTTVRPSGQPDTVPIWFLWKDGQFLIYSRQGAPKLRNLESNPLVSVAVDDTRGGDDVVRFEGTARVDADHAPAYDVPEYVAKYQVHIERLGYGDPKTFAAEFSVPILVTPTRYRRWA